VVAADFEDAEAGKMEAGSGIKSTFPRVTVSTTRASLESEGGDSGRWCDSDSGGINSVDAADDTGDVDGKEISSPSGERETGGCDTLVVGVGGACDSALEVGLERGELGMCSAMNV
jgi:hypothetical protein